MQTKLDRAVELLTEATSLLLEFSEEHSAAMSKVNRLLSTFPTTTTEEEISVPRNLKKYLRLSTTKAPWQAHALSFLETERKAEQVVEHLETLGMDVTPAAVYKWLRSRQEIGVLRRLARGWYQTTSNLV